jgi:hypothetical protein
MAWVGDGMNSDGPKRMAMPRGGKILLSTTFGIFLFAVSWPLIAHGSRDLACCVTGLPPRHDVIESLRFPRRLSGWSRDGLHTLDGEVIALPGIETLPEQSRILNEIVHRCVEVDPDNGRVYGLLPIDHWCGNDPIRRHLARVDVESLLTYLALRADPEHGSATFDSMGCDAIEEQGWNVVCFDGYERWLEDTGSPR